MTITNAFYKGKEVSFSLLFLILLVNHTIANNSLETKTEIIGQKYCLDKSPVLVEDSKTKKLIEVAKETPVLELQVELEIRNVDSKQIIIQKDFFAITRSVLAKNLSLYKRGKFISDTRGFVNPLFNTLDEKYPPDDRFLILKPKDSFSKNLSLYLDLGSQTEVIEGNYVLGLVIYVWGGQDWAGKELRKRWKDFGYLWLDPVRTYPILLSINNPKNIQECPE